jgi:DNA polymerase V
MFALIDANNFYVSCHRAFNPRLKGKPVVVLSNNDGCCVARSSEVKALGVRMATPWFQLRGLARQHGIIALSSNYALYGDMSQRFMRVLSHFSAHQEVYSIDECFLDLTGVQAKDRVEYGQQMRQRVLKWLGLPVCVGIAPTKTLAKLANHVAKKRAQYDSVFDYALLTPQAQDALLAGIEVGEVWGIGRRLAGRLNKHGITTVHDLKHADHKALRRQFSVVVERTILELQGIPCLGLEEIAPNKKEIISSRSFGKPVTELEDLKQAVASYTARAAEKLRSQHSVAENIQVFLQTNMHKAGEPQYHPNIVIPLVQATDNTHTLVSCALSGLRQIHKPGYRYNKAGVMLLGFHDAATGQIDLFSQTLDDSVEKSTRLMETLDRINRKMGGGTLRLAAEGYQQAWKVKTAYSSPRYTTHWGELAIAYAK